jgi:hypothetical protein
MNPGKFPERKHPAKQRGKEETKKKDPSLGQKSKTQSKSLRDKGTNHVPKLSLVPRSISEKKRNKKLEKTISLEKFSLAPSHIKIKVARALYKATDTFYL